MRAHEVLPRPRTPEAGTTHLETVVAISVISLLLATLWVGLAGNSLAVGAALDDAAAGRAAAARLEILRRGRAKAVPGTRSFEPDPEACRILPGLEGEEVVKEAGRGLLSVEVRVRWAAAGGEERSAALATLLAREEAR